MNSKEKLLAATLLKQAADHYADHYCNDFEFPAGWTPEEVRKFVDEFYAWNGDQDAQDSTHPGYLNLPDFSVMELLAEKLRHETLLKTTTP